ncbi:helix-turn-helix domain-containing protein [Streptomyces sp. NPDC057939]|uniref:helix-turn-helix domain-containing protein n=1 Tax=Streptomyces sp. NPDC057939 TaxID=3346284 RepID=UPI0036EF03B8
MTETASTPTAAAAQLAATADRVVALGVKLGRDREEVLDPPRLNLASGVPVDVVRALLGGRQAGEPDLQERFKQRLRLLHETHLHETGRKYSHGEIAARSGFSRQQIQALFAGDRRPTMQHCAMLEKFFRRPAGFLQSEDIDALTTALVAIEKSLLQEYSERGTPANPPSAPGAPSIYARHGVDGIALRAALMPDKGRRRLLEWMDDYLAENPVEGDAGAAGGPS